MGLKLETFTVTNLANFNQPSLSLGIDNSCVHCFFPAQLLHFRWLSNWASEGARTSRFNFVLCSGVKHPLRVWGAGCLSRQVKDRSVKSDREWEGLAEEENLMGKSECSGSRVVVSLTYLLCATHETFSCSSRFFPRHLSSPFSRLSPLSSTSGNLSIVFPVLRPACWMFHECFYFIFYLLKEGSLNMKHTH